MNKKIDHKHAGDYQGKGTEPVLGMVLKGYPRISETFISNEILLLEQAGIRIRIFSMRQPRENFSHANVKLIQAPVDYLPETLLLPLPRFLYHNLQLALKIPQNYWKALKMALRRFRRTRRLATLKHLFQAGYLVHRYLPGTGVVHLHAHFAHSPTSVALFTSILSGLPFSFTAHAKDIYTSNPEQLREKISLARFTVTCTGFNKKYLNSLSNGTGAPIHRIYHGIDTRLFEQQETSKRAANGYRLLTVARLIPKKGLPTVYRALQNLRDRGIEVKHTLIGDGEDRDKVLKLIKHLELEPIARWLGTQPHSAVIDHYCRADVFVLGCEVTSNGDRDGIPNVLMESMAMGVPVVATTVSAIPELVEDGVTGLLVPPGDEKRMAEAVIRLLTDRPLRDRIIAAARERVRNHFDNRVLIKELAAIYRKELKVASGEWQVARDK